MKILIVDDQPEPAGALADALQVHLGEAGEVHTALGGEQAVALAGRVGAPDVLVTEVVMDGMDGFHLREHLLATRPDLRTIYLTGYDLSPYADYTRGSPILVKPAEPRDILDALPGAATPAAPEVTVNPARVGFAPGERVEAPATTGTAVTEGDRGAPVVVSPEVRSMVKEKGFSGRLDQFGLADIVQMCCQSARSGRLSVSRGQERGVLFLERGNIVHAASGRLAGEEAVFDVVNWQHGQFNFEDGRLPAARTIHTAWQFLLLESARREDERRAAEDFAETAPAGAPPAPRTGQTLGPYRLRRLLGRDEDGETFEALQTSLDRPVALKVLGSGPADDPGLAQGFLARASVRASVQHPSILSVYEAGQVDGHYFYAREFADGTSLRDLHQEGGTLEDASARRVLRAVAEALSYLAQAKIPHLPLRPEGIYLTRDGQPRVSNLALLPGDVSPPLFASLRALAHAVTDVLPGRQAAAPDLQVLLGRMIVDAAGGFPSWAALLREVRALEP